MLALLYRFMTPLLPFYLQFGSSWEGMCFKLKIPGCLNSTNWNVATLAAVCRLQLYAYINPSVYKSQSRGWTRTYVRSSAKIVRLYQSTFSLICGWYVVVKLLFIDMSLHNTRMYSFSSCTIVSPVVFRRDRTYVSSWVCLSYILLRSRIRQGSISIEWALHWGRQ